MKRNFAVDVPNKLWVADTLASHRIAPSAGVANHLRTELVNDALKMAVRQRQPKGVIHHSDQGSQYASLISGNVAGKRICALRWNRLAIDTTMRSARASLQLWNASCWIVAGLALEKKLEE